MPFSHILLMHNAISKSKMISRRQWKIFHPPQPSSIKGHLRPSREGNILNMIAWEVTRSCNLNCVHCRAAANCGPYPGELSTEKCFQLIDEIAAMSSPVIILTGGEPLLRPDIFEIASYGTNKGLRMVMATNGTLVNPATAKKMIQSGIKRVSISIDGKDAASHDAFRQEKGAFDEAMAGIDAMKEAGMEFQINTTITTANLKQIKDILELAKKLGAAAHHIFLLVPTGRGRDLAEQAITAADYEETLMWFHQESLSCEIQLKATCAPHYFRIMHQNKAKGVEPKKKPGGPLSRIDKRLSRRYFLLLHFSCWPGSALRLSGTGLRQCSETELCRNLGKFGSVWQFARFE